MKGKYQEGGEHYIMRGFMIYPVRVLKSRRLERKREGGGAEHKLHVRMWSETVKV
jgi:hypothetical protein